VNDYLQSRRRRERRTWRCRRVTHDFAPAVSPIPNMAASGSPKHKRAKTMTALSLSFAMMTYHDPRLTLAPRAFAS